MILELTPHYAKDYSMILALFDFIPVFLFLFSGILLLKDLHKKLTYFFYSLLSAGILMIFVSGVFKSIWKIIAALGICDFAAFNLLFFPISSIGFIFCGIGLIDLFRKKETKLTAITPFFLLLLINDAPLEMKNNGVIFIILQTIGCSMLLILLFLYALQKKNTQAWICLILSFIFMWGMGGLAAMDGKMNVTLWNWLEEIVNTLSQASLLIGVYFLHKKQSFE